MAEPQVRSHKRIPLPGIYGNTQYNGINDELEKDLKAALHYCIKRKKSDVIQIIFNKNMVWAYDEIKKISEFAKKVLNEEIKKISQSLKSDLGEAKFENLADPKNPQFRWIKIYYPMEEKNDSAKKS